MVEMVEGGKRNRLATLLWYMQEPTAGGETHFPRAGGLGQVRAVQCSAVPHVRMSSLARSLAHSLPLPLPLPVGRRRLWAASRQPHSFLCDPGTGGLKVAPKQGKATLFYSLRCVRVFYSLRCVRV
jgi:hypothetical protein